MSTKRLLRAAKSGNIDRVRKILGENADNRTLTNGEGENVLHCSAESGSLTLSRYLVEDIGIDVDSRTLLAKTPLHYASWGGHTEVVKYLLERGARVDARNRISWTPLLFCASKGHFGVCRILVENNANINHCNRDGATPLYLSSREGHLRVVEYLYKYGGDINVLTENGRSPLLCAIMRGHSSVVKFLLCKGAATDIRDNSGKSVWHEVAWSGHISCAEVLVQEGVFLFDNNYDSAGRHPLHVASMLGNEELVQWMIHNVSHWRYTKQPISKEISIIDIVDADGQTALFWSCTSSPHNSCAAVVSLLLRNGSCPDGCNTQRYRSPLHSAVSWGRVSCVALLISAGANVFILDHEGKTPLEIALENGNEDIVNMLKMASTATTCETMDDTIDRFAKVVNLNRKSNNEVENSSQTSNNEVENSSQTSNNETYFFDSHCHTMSYDFFDSHCHTMSYEDVIKQSLGNISYDTLNTTKRIIVSICESDWKIVSNIYNQYKSSILLQNEEKISIETHEKCIIGFGIHPWAVPYCKPDWENHLIKYLKLYQDSIVGEIGLDYCKKGVDKVAQLSVFQKQMQIAATLSRPVSIHCVRATGAMINYFMSRCIEHSDTSAILPYSVSFHAYSVQALINLEKKRQIRFFFGFNTKQFNSRSNRKSSKLTKLNSSRQKLIDCIKNVPRDRLLVESDLPLLKISTLHHIEFCSSPDSELDLNDICNHIAELRGWSFKETVSQIHANTLEFLHGVKKKGHGC